MTTPSNPSGIPSLPVVALLAVILFLGLALAPRAFEFRAWPEATAPAAREEVVDRPMPEAAEIEVAGVDARESRREATGRKDSPDTRARDERPATERPRSRDRSSKSSARSGRRGGRGEAPATVGRETVVEVPDAPAETPAATPEQPAQLAEVPPSEQVLRPEPQQVPDAPPVPEFEVDDLTGEGGLDVRGELDELGVCGRRGNGRHRGHGRANGHGDGPRGHCGKRRKQH